MNWKLFLFALLFALVAVFGDRGLLGLVRIRKQEARLKEQNRSVALKNETLAEEIRRLKEHPALERLIRSELGFARDGEEIYEFGNP